MTDDIWKRDEIESPCLKVCVMHPEAKLCVGCKRTAEEIANWTRYSALERRQIMNALPEREAVLKTRKGGRRARLNRR